MQSFFNICSVYEQEKNRINKDGEIVISSTKTRTQKLVSAPCFFSVIPFSYLPLYNWFDSATFPQGQH